MSFRKSMAENIAARGLLEYCAQLHRLTPGEAEVIHWVAKGVPQKEMAFLRKVSIKTISTQKRSAFMKMQVSSDVECIHYLYFLKNQLTNPAPVSPSPQQIISLC